ncbi:MAG: S24 family peptidase [Candidatus Shapirobacteria bacterium]|jgi:repressor LexA|nr:S24 family peptidase [Candidatus Shapirobacteria bacterium]
MHEIQEKLLKIISEKNLSGVPLRKIGELINETSAQKIRHHLSQLSKKGFITFDSKKREINIIPKVSKDGIFVSVPIVGSANCGPESIFADERVEGYLKISKKMVPSIGNLYVLRAEGNSMNKANIAGSKKIEDGDFVLVDSSQKNSESGQYVVSIIDGKANIKKIIIEKENNRIVLKSESTQNYLPIFIHEDDNYQISGRVVDVIKK